MRIALFGASGKTGKEFLRKALSANHKVKALARTPEKIPLDRHAELTVVEGNVLNETDVAETISGTEVVLSLFGHVKDSPKWLQTKGTKNIIGAMKNEGVKRVISLSGGGLPFPEKDRPKLPDLIIRTIMKLAVPTILNDAKAHAEVLKKSGLDWTIVRGPRLTEEPEKGAYRIGWVGVNASTEIGRADLADFLLTQLDDHRFVHQMPFVSY